MAARRLGMPTPAIATHAGVLATMEYSLKTTFAISSHSIWSSPENPLFSTGQGSGASPAVWLSISTILLQALRSLIPRGMVFTSPTGFRTVSRHSDAFVDDTQNGLNDSGIKEPWSIWELVSNLQDMAQAWERLLFTSGGALELSKCSYYVMHWEWNNGLPHLTPKNKVAGIKKITLTSGTSTQQIKILQRDPSEAHKTLGVYVAPDGNERAQEEYLNTKSHQIASLVSSSQLKNIGYP